MPIATHRSSSFFTHSPLCSDVRNGAPLRHLIVWSSESDIGNAQGFRDAFKGKRSGKANINTDWGGRFSKRFRKMFSGSSPCLLGQHCTCSSAQLPVELSENMLKNILLNLLPHTVCFCSVPSAKCFKGSNPAPTHNEL